MASLMRCATAHWQGDKFIPQGTIRPAGHSEALAAFFEPFDVPDEAPKTTKK